MGTGSSAGGGVEVAWAGSTAFQHVDTDRLGLLPLDPAAVARPTRLHALPFFHDRHRHLPAAGAVAGGPPIAEDRAREARRLAADGFCASVIDMGVGMLEAWPDRPAWARSALRGLTGEGAGEHARRYAAVVHHGGSAAAAVHEQADAGADLVKVIATGSGLAPSAEAMRPVMDDATLIETFEAAAARGMAVAIHCHGGVVADRAIAAGVHSIEHGLYLSDEQLLAMRDAGVTLTLTPGVYLGADPPAMGPVLARLVRRAMDLELRLAVGTDGEDQTMLGQLQTLVELGMPFEWALRAAADWTGPDEPLVGTGRPLLLFADDPATDVRRLAHPVAIARPERATHA